MQKFTFYSNLGLLVFVLFTTFCSTNTQKQIPQMSFEEFQPLLEKDNDTVYVINFWATWCKPCVKEFPDFEKLNKEYKSKNVKVYMVSLDFPDKLEELVIPFIEKNNVKSNVIHLTDTDANKWINKVSPLWSGAIPATMIYKGNSAEFHEESMTYEELKAIVESKI